VSYFFSKTIDASFEMAEEKIGGLLKDHGFGILTEIDVQATLKNKLNVDFRKYKILGACNPPYALKALLAEDKIGLMLPCNVVVQESGEGKTEVAIIDPVASMAAVKNDKLNDVAIAIRDKLKTIIDKL